MKKDALTKKRFERKAEAEAIKGDKMTPFLDLVKVGELILLVFIAIMGVIHPRFGFSMMLIISYIMLMVKILS